MKTKQTLYQWLTTNFIVHIRNEENFSLKRSFTINYAKILVMCVSAFLTFAVLNFYILKIISSYSSNEAKREKVFNEKLIKLAVSIDSLERDLAMKDSFIMDIKKVMTGEEIKKKYINADEKKTPEVIDREERFSEPLSEEEAGLRDEFEKTQLNSSSGFVNLQGNLSDIFFFAPSGGLISKPFNQRNNHLGIDIVANENEPIKSVADGSIVYAGWSFDTGYMLIIQHHKELISVYKHNAALMKKVGEQVKAGEVVAIMGNSGELTSGPHLHFELWYNGNPLNPLDYIVF